MNHLVVFASGTGSNFQAVINAIDSGFLEAYIAGLITNNEKAGCLQIAQNNGIPAAVINQKSYTSDDEYTAALLAQLQQWKPDLIILAGFLKKIPGPLIQAYPDRILNIHPALLPKFGGKGFYGMNVHRAVIDAGETESGCTVHLVNEEYDKGPVLGRSVTQLLPGETAEELAERVLHLEHKLYPAVIQQYLETLTNK